jgi:hypothetical protein
MTIAFIISYHYTASLLDFYQIIVRGILPKGGADHQILYMQKLFGLKFAWILIRQ